MQYWTAVLSPWNLSNSGKQWHSPETVVLIDFVFLPGYMWREVVACGVHSLHIHYFHFWQVPGIRKGPCQNLTATIIVPLLFQFSVFHWNITFVFPALTCSRAAPRLPHFVSFETQAGLRRDEYWVGCSLPPSQLLSLSQRLSVTPETYHTCNYFHQLPTGAQLLLSLAAAVGFK